jgi:hypothetical protein
MAGEITQEKGIDPLGANTTVNQCRAAGRYAKAHNSLGLEPEVGDADPDDGYASHNGTVSTSLHIFPVIDKALGLKGRSLKRARHK